MLKFYYRFIPVEHKMNVLKEKSKFNTDAADLLIKNYLYAPSIHCSYYSCLQFMKHIILNKLGINPVNYASDNGFGSDRSHETFRDIIIKDLKNRQKREWREFNTQFGQLKSSRIQSDYDEIEINEPVARTSKNLSDSTLRLLKQIYL